MYIHAQSLCAHTPRRNEPLTHRRGTSSHVYIYTSVLQARSTRVARLHCRAPSLFLSLSVLRRTQWARTSNGLYTYTLRAKTLNPTALPYGAARRRYIRQCIFRGFRVRRVGLYELAWPRRRKRESTAVDPRGRTFSTALLWGLFRSASSRRYCMRAREYIVGN